MYQKLTDGPTPKEIRRRSPVILYRKGKGFMEQDELKIADKFFVTIDSRMRVHRGDIVIGRYSVLPYYTELSHDLKLEGCDLINSFQEHRYVADLQNWYYDLEEFTPKTWFRLEDVPDNVGRVILKGETNSLKEHFNTLMFANNKKEAIELYIKLSSNGLLEGQNIYIREFVPFKKYMTNLINGLPITEEYRFFILDGKIMSSGFYWSPFVEELGFIPSSSVVPIEFINNVISRIENKIRFVVVDIGRLENGNWMVVELNDGQQSGLSECDPYLLYKNLKDTTWNNLPGI